MALALRVAKSSSRVYVIMGDGELAEGQLWEAAMAAARYGLDSITAIVDRTDQATGQQKKYSTSPTYRRNGGLRVERADRKRPRRERGS